LNFPGLIDILRPRVGLAFELYSGLIIVKLSFIYFSKDSIFTEAILLPSLLLFIEGVIDIGRGAGAVYAFL
jgi:hypothetical protein